MHSIQLFSFLGNISDIQTRGTHREFYFEESPKLIQLRLAWYEKFLQDIEYSCIPGAESLLFHIPSQHAYLFLQKLFQMTQDAKSFLFGKNIEIVVFSDTQLSGISQYKKETQEQYELLLQKIFAVDKFIEVYNSLQQFSSYDISREDKDFIVPLDYHFKAQSQKGKNPRMKSYFPSLDQAEQENMSLKKYYEFVLGTMQMDWSRIQSANQDLVQLFCEYESVHMFGTHADIMFDITGMGARNSVIETNYPGCEVFSCPTTDGVDGWIEYHNPVLYHYSGEILTGLRVEISGNILEEIHIFGVEGKSGDEEKKGIKNIMNHFEEKSGNKRVGELAFGTNFFVPTGVKQILIGEKAFGMHFSFGKALPFEGTDNGNQDTTMHWDLIRDMSDDIQVTFSKKSGESLLVMKDGVFTQEACPNIYAYYTEIMKK